MKMRHWSPEVKSVFIGSAFAAIGYLVWNYYDRPGASFVGFYYRKIADILPTAVPLYLVVVAAIVCLVIGIVLTRALWPRRMSSTGSVGRAESAKARITCPTDGARFLKGTAVLVKGTYKRLPRPGEQLVVATSRQGTYYPQGRLIHRVPRAWECVCDEHSVGETLIHVGVADERYLDRARQYADTGRAGEGWHGFRLGIPPDGLHIDHTIAIHIDPSSPPTNS